MKEKIENVYGHRVRVRVCGLCFEGDDLLMVNHKGLTGGDFWAPPGGGMEFGEKAADCLVREFREETGLDVEVGRFCFACEYLTPPLHAIELFFEVSVWGGSVVKGDDPELPIISDVRFLSPSAIGQLPPASLHGIFQRINNPAALRTLTGFYTI